jgi:serine/threonine-protein kinase
MSETGLLNNRYQLERKLGSGGMATVYRANDLMLERSVAIKILRSDYSQDPAFRERFRQEAKAVANLTHPNIVTIHDFGLDHNRLFIIMEHVPGSTLKDLINKRGRMTIERAIHLMVQACAGIGYAHRAGLVHCDIKPQNILVSPDKRVKVTDFGIARALASIHPRERTDVVWGSPQYFSPEQAAGNAPSPASDVYGLGVILYEMLTGQLPFTAQTSVDLARQHRKEAPKPPRQINPAINPNLEHIILKVLSKEPAARYRTADQLGRVLITFAEGSSRQQTFQAIQPPKGIVSPPSEKQISKTPIKKVTPEPVPASPQNVSQIDWITTGLGFTALLAVGGLVPFLLWVYFTIKNLR